MIMPLANRRDKYYAGRVGHSRLQHRFGREPEGMWLPRPPSTSRPWKFWRTMASSSPSSPPRKPSTSAALARHQFKNVEGGKIDPTAPLRLHLPSGRSINLFFYDGPISRAVAFEGLLSNGERSPTALSADFPRTAAGRSSCTSPPTAKPTAIITIKGEMALSYALHHIESKKLAQLTNYGEYLTHHPPTHEVEIIENTSWSCSHGVERWSSDCSCNSGSKPGWNQSWRAPLRDALDHLRDSLAEPFEKSASELLVDPWLARDEYVNIVLDRGDDSLNRFLAAHARRGLSEAEIGTILSLLEIQRHAMLMYTSCGWFFDELSGLETVQVIMYAGRTLQLAQRLFPDHHEETFRELLQSAKSNIPEYGDGAHIFDRFVKPAQVDLLAVAAHYAIASMFQLAGDGDLVRAYEIQPIEDVRLESGRARLALGATRVRSRITRRHREVAFGVLHFGDHNLMAGVREYPRENDFHAIVNDVREPFQSADLPATVRLLDRHFEGATYSLKSLFRDERQKVVGKLLGSTMAEAEAAYRQIYEHHAPLMGFLSGMGAPLPKMLHLTAEFVLNTSLRQEFMADELDLERVRSLLETAAREKIQWDSAWLGYALTRRFARMADELALKPHQDLLHRFNLAVDLVRSLPFEVDLARVQNVYYQLLQSVYPVFAQQEGAASRPWIAEFTALGNKLGVCVDPPPVPTAPAAQ